MLSIAGLLARRSATRTATSVSSLFDRRAEAIGRRRPGRLVHARIGTMATGKSRTATALGHRQGRRPLPPPLKARCRASSTDTAARRSLSPSTRRPQEDARGDQRGHRDRGRDRGRAGRRSRRSSARSSAIPSAPLRSSTSTSMRCAGRQGDHLEVPVRLIGVPDGVRNFGGVLEQLLHDLQIEALPADIPEHVELDVTGLGSGSRCSCATSPPGPGRHRPDRPTDGRDAARRRDAGRGARGARDGEPELIRKPKAEASEGEAEKKA